MFGHTSGGHVLMWTPRCYTHYVNAPTDHLGEVCERSVGAEEAHVRSGKQREWDGRGKFVCSSALCVLLMSHRALPSIWVALYWTGSGVAGWGTEEEEDIWETAPEYVATEAQGEPRNERWTQQSRNCWSGATCVMSGRRSR